MSDEPHCYAVRRLNPFMGVVEVVEITGARALSNDGRQWEIQVEAERPEHTWRSIEPARTVRQLFRFGSWNAGEGLRQVPVNPLLDIGAMLGTSERLIAALAVAEQGLPFPCTDRFEQWLLDPGGRPLALLASTTEARFTPQIRADRWQATLPTDTDFVSDGLAAEGIANRDPHGARHHAAMLERQLRGAAGPAARHCWYQRQADGSGRPLDEGCAALPAQAFPELPLRSHWPSPRQQTLASDYLHWLAPRLLTLDTLGDALRRELERAACRRALLLADQYRLYPKVLQRDLLDTARVEARLRRAAG